MQWIAHKLEALHDMLDKYWLYVQHFENIISNPNKQTDKSKLEGKLSLFSKVEFFVFEALFFNLL